MDYEHYLERFRKSAGQLDKALLHHPELRIHVGVTLESVVLKLYKPDWTNDPSDPVQARTRICFAIWVNAVTLKRSRVYYNIHALKLRGLKGYTLTSRAFADQFRTAFKEYTPHWEHVSVSFGPLTLMEGWEHFEDEQLEQVVVKLASNFITIAPLIDQSLAKFKLNKSV